MAAGKRRRAAQPSSSSSRSEPSPSATNPEPPPISLLDLPTYLCEKILERLPVADYLRFGAVCRQCRSTQSDHRRRRAPMLTRPWFVPRHPKKQPVRCSDLFSPEGERRSHRLRIPLPDRYLELRRKGNRTEIWDACHFSLPNGWLMLDDKPLPEEPETHSLTLMNPLMEMQDQIKLPKIDCEKISLAAASSPPNVALLLLTYDEIKGKEDLCLFRDGEDHCWLKLVSRELCDDVMWDIVSLVFWQKKFYCLCQGWGFLVIDPLPSNPEAYYMNMEQSALPVLDWDENQMEAYLVETGGRVLLVVGFLKVIEGTCTWTQKFEVLEADIDGRRWVKVESLVDGVLLVYGGIAVSLVAADNGAERNCIYYIDGQDEDFPRWLKFDMDSGMDMEASLRYAPPPSTHLMLMPSVH